MGYAKGQIKKQYESILKKFNGKKTVIKKLHAAFKIYRRNFYLKNELFTYSSYGTDWEIICIGEIHLTNYTFLTYTCLSTRVVVEYIIDDYHDKFYQKKSRILNVPRKKNLKLYLYELYKFQKYLFENCAMDFIEYKNHVLHKTTINIHENYFYNIKLDYGAPNSIPEISWHHKIENNIESVQIKNTSQGMIVILAMNNKSIEIIPPYTMPRNEAFDLFA